MDISISERISYNKLLRFTLPSMGMMLMCSLFEIVDGFFLSNYAGVTSLAAINFIWPPLQITGAVGFMFGTGGSVLVTKLMGEGEEHKARETFSMLVASAAAAGIVLAAAGLMLIRPAAIVMGARGLLLEESMSYGVIFLISLPFYILQVAFQSFMSAAGRPGLGFFYTLAAGAANVFLDWLLIAVIPLGIAGAAIGTAAAQLIGTALPLAYFAKRRPEGLRLVKPVLRAGHLSECCVNGLSEFLSFSSASAVEVLYNIQLLRYSDESGVAAYGVMSYLSIVFLALFNGYSIGVSPLISYRHGAGRSEEVRDLKRKSLVIVATASVLMLALSEALAMPLSRLFVGYDEALSQLTCRGLRVYAVMFLFAGFSIFISAYFTGIGNAPASALVSLMRTLIFPGLFVIALPLLCGMEGIWAASPAAEISALALSAAMLRSKDGTGKNSRMFAADSPKNGR